MASNRIGETGFPDSGHSNHHIPYSIFHGINTSASLMYVSDALTRLIIDGLIN